VLEIDVDISANLRERLLAQHIDLAFMVGPVGSPTIRHRQLRSERVAFLASPRLGLPRRRVKLQRLADYPLITFSRNTQPFADVTELFAGSEHALPRIHASSSLATIVKMALDGLGVAVIPPSIVRREIKALRLVEVDCEARVPDLHFFAGWLATPAIGIVAPVVDIAAEVTRMHKDARPPRHRRGRYPAFMA
jgi:DNA-binding transcriptional LysR family regulator